MSSRSSRSASASNNGSSRMSNSHSSYNNRSGSGSRSRTRERNGSEILLNASTDPREFHWRAMRAPRMSRKFVNTSISGVTVLPSHTKPGIDTLSLIMNEIISTSLHRHQYDEQVEQFWRNYILLIAEVDYRDKRVIDVFVYRKGPNATGLTTQHLMMANDIDLQSFQSLQIAMRIDGSLRITLGNDSSSSSYSGSKSKSYGGASDNPRKSNSGYNTPSTSDDTDSDDDGYSHSQSTESSNEGSSDSSSAHSSVSSGDNEFDYTM